MMKHPTGGKGEVKGQGRINRAQEHEPHEGAKKKPSASRGGSEVGQERHADMRGTQLGGSRAEGAGNPLGHAVHELKTQHPEHHHDLGPHHGGRTHERHEPMHGLKTEHGNRKHHER